MRVIAGDGADWGKRGLGHFAGSVYQLRRFHLARKIRECLGNGTALGRVYGARNQPERLLEEVQPAARCAVDAVQAEKAREPLNYVVANIDGLPDYRSRVDVEGLELRGLGAIEGNIDKQIFKPDVYMAWTLRGGANMLALITLRANSLLLPAALARLPRLYSKAYPLV